jgi:glycosyltransferase involved in cell wall biosynthesis
MDKIQRILLVIDEASVGGGQRHVLWLAEGLVRDGYEIAIACERQGYLVDELRSIGIRHLPVDLGNHFSVKSLFRMIRLIREFDPTVVHTHGGTAGVYGRSAARFLNRTTVHTYHGIHYLHFEAGWKKRIYLFLEQFLLRWTDAIICVANSDLELALNHNLAERGRAFVIVNGINLRQFRAPDKRGKRQWGRKRGVTIIGTVGRLHGQKGHRYLIQAVLEIVKQPEPVEFRIIGDGNLRSELELQVQTLGLQKVIRFLGSRTDIAAQLAQMDLFVLPSLWEGLPFVLLEAMAAGIPIIASEVDGVSEILEDGKDALLVPPRDPHSLAMAIVKLIHNKKEAIHLATNALHKISERFDVKEMVRQTERVYRTVLKSSSR